MNTLFRKGALLVAAGVLATAGTALAQNAAQNAAKPQVSYPTIFMTGFFGGNWYQLYQGENARSHTFDRGITWGERVTEDLWDYFGLEQSLVIGYNKLNIPMSGNRLFQSNTVSTQLTANVMAYLMPRGSKYRPYFTIGPGYMWYGPKGNATVPVGVPYNGLQRKGVPMLNYGLGLRTALTKRFGVNYEVRAIHTASPKFGLPAGPVNGPNTLFLPNGDAENAIYFNVGLNYNIKIYNPPPPPDPTRDLNANVSAPQSSGLSAAVTGNPNQVCRGDNVRLTANANGFGPSPAYQWLVNGQPAAGGTANAFSVATTNPGASAVSVRVTGGNATSTASIAEAVRAGDRLHAIGVPQGANVQWMLNGQPISGATGNNYVANAAAVANGYSVQVSVPNAPVTSSVVNVNVLPVQPPTVQFAVSPSTVPYGTRIPLTAQGRAVNNCNGNVTVSFSGEGVGGTNFDSSSVSGLDMSNRLKAQSKQVRLTATARDARGQTATANADVTVTLGTEARRLDDIVFQSLSSRVNNCGKRLLLETLTPLLRDDPGATVILIGHRDERERGSRAAKLDQERVNNAAAVLSAGEKICPALDLSRIKVKAAGTDQSTQTRPALCGSSVNERSGAEVKGTDDRAQFRRVEVWIVPSGAAMPAGITGLVDAPSADIKKLGCPK